MENKRQTPIQLLYSWLEVNQYYIGNDLLAVLPSFIEFEKEVIVNAYHTGTSHEYNSVENGTEYYEKYFITKDNQALQNTKNIEG